jgi:hypothetical protein
MTTRLRTLRDSYWVRIVGGSLGLFVVLPVLMRAFGADYTLGVYIGTGIACATSSPVGATR